MNKNVTPVEFYPRNTSIHSLFIIEDMKPTFPKETKVYLLYTPFQKKSSLNFKSSIQLGKKIKFLMYHELK